jgi:hypothetical protein
MPTLNGQQDARSTVILGDCLAEMRKMPDKSVDLVCCSPPYEAARTYGIDFALRGQDWVDWAKERYVECLRVCKGLVCWVCEGQTRQFRYSAAPILLMADLHRAGVKLRKPPIFARVGIPGSGGPDWLRNDYEFCICASHGKLPWSDNTAMGHPPKWAPGGEMSNRLSDGARVNQWGKNGSPRGMGNKNKDGEVDGKPRPSHVFRVNERKQNGERTATMANGRKCDKLHTNAEPDGTMCEQGYTVRTLANPGNIIKCIVGGGVMGHELAHENEAPYPLSLATFFVRSFCPPGGVVLDPFSGSGTTGHAALQYSRRYIGIDIRESQVELTKRRLATVQPELFA